MQVFTIARAGLAGLSLFVLASCDEASVPSGTLGQKSFKSEYSAAREALEKGKFEQAQKKFRRLMADSGALAPRIRLELAHAYLRAGAFDKAAAEARDLAAGLKGQARAAALSVQATAEHEMALKAIAAGDGSAAEPLLNSADQAMEEVLDSHATLDPLGSLAGRRASIKVQLGNL